MIESVVFVCFAMFEECGSEISFWFVGLGKEFARAG